MIRAHSNTSTNWTRILEKQLGVATHCFYLKYYDQAQKELLRYYELRERFSDTAYQKYDRQAAELKAKLTRYTEEKAKSCDQTPIATARFIVDNCPDDDQKFGKAALALAAFYSNSQDLISKLYKKEIAHEYIVPDYYTAAEYLAKYKEWRAKTDNNKYDAIAAKLNETIEKHKKTFNTSKLYDLGTTFNLTRFNLLQLAAVAISFQPDLLSLGSSIPFLCRLGNILPKLAPIGFAYFSAMFLFDIIIVAKNICQQRDQIKAVGFFTVLKENLTKDGRHYRMLENLTWAIALGAAIFVGGALITNISIAVFACDMLTAGIKGITKLRTLNQQLNKALNEKGLSSKEKETLIANTRQQRLSIIIETVYNCTGGALCLAGFILSIFCPIIGASILAVGCLSYLTKFIYDKRESIANFFGKTKTPQDIDHDEISPVIETEQVGTKTLPQPKPAAEVSANPCAFHQTRHARTPSFGAGSLKAWYIEPPHTYTPEISSL